MKKYDSDLVYKFPKVKKIKVEGLENAYSNLWDKAHALKKDGISFVEPNLTNTNAPIPPEMKPATKLVDGIVFESFSREDVCAKEIEYDSDWEFPKKDDTISHKKVWHLEDSHSQLLSARKEISSIIQKRKNDGQPINIVRIAHFDTGFDPTHKTFPENLVRLDLAKDFTENPELSIAVDSGEGMNGGHGTGTLSILAGKSYQNDYGFTENLGLSADQAIEIVPIRIAKSVILFKNDAFSRALNYIISLYDDKSTRCHIITMSMGGAASNDWADAVNAAYEKGIFIVSAAGNNMGGCTPRVLVYPARFNRVVAACGVTHDLKPYFKTSNFLHFNKMQGNYGPEDLMNTAIAAFTPNVPWARYDCGAIVSIAGAGTSSATPQVASAAALFYQKHYDKIENLPKAWMKIEAIRYALFNSASKKSNGFDERFQLYFGNGILKAKQMLNDDFFPDVSQLKKQKKDSAFLGVIKIIKESIASVFGLEAAYDEQMLDLELTQLIHSTPELLELLDNEEKNFEDLSNDDKQTFLSIIKYHNDASKALKSYISQYLNE